ncbi:AAA family ATPase [Methylobacterium sp. DB0501]|uniref:TniB family NTP-binding protein n=1 Tax=Methylobacterium sp. DB0501 TaxID=2709665 RepID=UPI0013E9D7D6|nr:TniB family NTP-binding protein [Methylobacterium sp. DB0501]NGM33057.1 AAA family ATPase [Methylobacterium sp. DB0501]
MSERYPHLQPDVRLLVDRSRQERIAFVQSDQWIGYPAATAAMDRLESILHHARARRMENCLLIGDSNNGKSTILETFAARHGDPVRLREPDGLTGHRPLSVVLIEMPKEANEALFWEAILERLRCAPPRRSENLMRYTCAILDQLAVRMLMIDELHNITRLPPRAQRDRLLLLKSLSNRLRLPIVAAGTRDAEAALKTDEQTANRFEPFVLPRWRLNQEFRSFVASYERLLPLPEPSNLADKEPLTALFNVSEGTVGRVVRVIQRATETAIEAGKPRVDLALLEAASRLPYGGERRRAAG